MAKNKMVAKTIRMSTSVDNLKMIDEYFDNHPETVRSVIFGQAIVEKVKELKDGTKN